MTPRPPFKRPVKVIKRHEIEARMAQEQSKSHQATQPMSAREVIAESLANVRAERQKELAMFFA